MELVEDKVLAVSSNTFETRWNKFVLRKVCIFVWRLMPGRIPIRVVLDRFCLDLNTILCPCCGEVIETVDHCIVLCNRVQGGWQQIFSWWNMGNFNMLSISDIINHEGHSNFDNNQKLSWQAVLWSIMYLIWNIRDKVVFKNSAISHQLIGDEVQMLLYFWMIHRSKGSISSLVEWQTNPAEACKK